MSAGMRVRVVRKLADFVDGIDLTHCTVGDVIDVSEPEALAMVAERWALPARRSSDAPSPSQRFSADAIIAADRRSPSNRRHSRSHNDLYSRLRDKRDQIERERRGLRRRSTDEGHSPTSHAA